MTIAITRVTQPIISDGGVLWLPEYCLTGLVNSAIPQDMYAGSATQGYPLGAKLYKNDKIYRYCKAGATRVARQAFLALNYNYDPGVTGHENVDGFEGALSVAVVAGDTGITIADTTARAKNYYEGSELVLQYDAGGFIHQYRILGNDLGASSVVKVYIAEPGAKTDCPISGTAVDAYMNRYSNIRSSASYNYSFFTAMGAFGGAVMTSGSFYWLQTGGLVTLTGSAGTTTGHRVAYCTTDGSVLDTEPVAAAQHVGYVVGGTISGYGSLLVYLTLDT